ATFLSKKPMQDLYVKNAGEAQVETINRRRRPLDNEIIQQFREAAERLGLIFKTGEPFGDGKLHRCVVESARRSHTDGAYILHLDGFPAGWFLNFKTGESDTWHGNLGRELTAATAN